MYMYKIFGIVCLGGIGILYSSVLAIIYLLSMIYLIITEVIGTKRFSVRFKKLNKTIFNEFKDTINTFKSVFELV